ncbi:MAG TPA: DinB family protein [Longimicrobiales bacterium]|nr:DinB family protein [Longimicrobiales bacterium]
MVLMPREQSAAPGDPRIRGYLEQLDAILLDARELAADLTSAQFNWRPDGRRWSVGQCLEHLTLTVRLYPRRIEEMIEEARSRSAAGGKPYREGWFSRWFVRSMEPPPSLRVRTFSKVEPPRELDRDAVLAAFEASHGRLADLMRAADGVSLTHGRMPSPFLSVLKFTMNQVFDMNLAHARRHLWQARQVVAHPSFPAGG